MTRAPGRIPEPPAFLVCPECRSGLAVGESRDRSLVCTRGHAFPAANGFVDFLSGRDAVDADWDRTRTDAERSHGHEAETEGLRHRVENYVLPFIDARFADRRAVRALDDGTGLGHTVALLTEHGVDAYGIDPGSRREQWDAGGLAHRLFSASGRALPFADETFDVVLSSGVLEHVGEHLPEGQRGGPCAEYVHEVLRVLKPKGAALLAAPNGLHPVDFWHTGGRALRVHSPREQWMPRPAEVRQWVASSPVPGTVRFLSPNHYLAFKNVQRHAYGRVLTGAMRALFAAMDRSEWLSRSALNPWLVSLVERADE